MRSSRGEAARESVCVRACPLPLKSVHGELSQANEAYLPRQGKGLGITGTGLIHTSAWFGSKSIATDHLRWVDRVGSSGNKGRGVMGHGEPSWRLAIG